MKNTTFEDFLREEFAKEYRGLDDLMPDAFSDWLVDLDVDTIIAYADKWGKIQFEAGKEEIKNIIISYAN